MKTGIELIAMERLRQFTEEGITPSHDDKHIHGELAIAAACYAVHDHGAKPEVAYIDYQEEEIGLRVIITKAWPWEKRWDKRDKHDRTRKLVIAGALIAAELDRIIRIAERDED